MKITATTSAEFREQFLSLLKLPSAATVRNIVYFYRVESGIPRVLDQSNILYIGQSKRTLFERYAAKRDFDIEVAYFNRFYRHVIRQYGALTIDIQPKSDPRYAEWEALAAYYNKHLEYPPLNRAIPNEPEKKS